jgi:hypothetical protein
MVNLRALKQYRISPSNTAPLLFSAFIHDLLKEVEYADAVVGRLGRRETMTEFQPRLELMF